MKVHLIRELHRLLRFVAVISFLFLFLFASTRLVTPLLNQQHARIETWLSYALEQPVNVSNFSVHWNILSPIIDFEDVIIWNDARTHTLLKVDRLNLQMDIWNSLWNRRFVLGELFISGAQLTLRQDKNMQWSVNAMHGLMKNETALEQQATVRELEEWLLSEKRVTLRNVAINVYPETDYPSSFFIGQLRLVFTPKNDRLQVDKGRLQFDGRDIRFGIKDIFRQKISLDALSGKLGWDISNGRWIVEVDHVRAHNPDLNVTAALVLQNTLDGASVMIDLKSDFNIFRIKNKSLYLPVSVLRPELVTWLDSAIVDGKAGNGKFVLRGDMRDFPFDKKKGVGEFLVDANLYGIQLAYESGWPPLQDLDAHLLFLGNRMEITSNKGKLLNARVQQVKAVIPDLEADISILYITGTIVGDSENGLAFIKQSPLEKTLGAELRNLRLHGPLQLGLGFSIPLDGPQPLELTGTAKLMNNQLAFPELQLSATQLQGALIFTKNTLDASNMKAYFLNHPVRLALKKEASSDVVVASVAGQLDTKTLRKEAEKTTWMTQRLPEGTMAYDATLSLATHNSKKKSSLLITSDLQGLRIDLLAPFGKIAKESKPSTLEITFDFKQSLSMLIHYGKQVQARLAYKIDGKQNLQFINGQLAFQSRDFSGVVYSPEASGRPWKAEFTHLYVEESEKGKKSFLSDFSPRDIPAISLQVENFQYDKKRLGQLKLRLEPIKTGLEIQKFLLTSPDFSLTANGAWEVAGKGTKTRLSGHAVSSNLETTLKRWNFSPDITGKNANLAFNLQWFRSPVDADFEDIEGRANIQIKNGQIVDIGSNAATQMSFGRLLNALSLETLRRRLKLDFSDLGHSGFSFDSLRGQFKLIKGSAFTEDVEIIGPVARIDMDGRIGIAAKDYDLKLTIIPNLTGNLPILATLFGGPIAGAAVFTADKLFGSAVGKITARRYQIQGSWDHPVISLIGTEPIPTDSK